VGRHEGADRETETFLECVSGTVRLQDETALVVAGNRFEVWRGPFTWSIGDLIEVAGPRGREVIVSPGRVVSAVTCRSGSG
jgi:hypothetical protein